MNRRMKSCTLATGQNKRPIDCSSSKDKKRGCQNLHRKWREGDAARPIRRDVLILDRGGANHRLSPVSP